MWYMRRKYIILPEMWQEAKFGELECVNFAILKIKMTEKI